VIGFDPDQLSGGAGFAQRMTSLIAAVTDQDGTRLPGAKRLSGRAIAQRDGVAIPAGLKAEIEALAGLA